RGFHRVHAAERGKEAAGAPLEALAELGEHGGGGAAHLVPPGAGLAQRPCPPREAPRGGARRPRGGGRDGLVRWGGGTARWGGGGGGRGPGGRGWGRRPR